MGKRMKQAYIRAKQRKVGDTSGTSPPPLGEGSAANQAGPENFSQPGNIPSAKGKTLKSPSPGERMKAAFLQARKAVAPEQSSQQNQQADPSAQAAEHVGQSGKRVGDSALCRVERTGRESLSQVKPRAKQVRESFQEWKSTVESVRQEGHGSSIKVPWPRKEGAASASPQQMQEQSPQSSARKRTPRAAWKERATIKTPAKGNVKTASRSVKTVEAAVPALRPASGWLPKRKLLQRTLKVRHAGPRCSRQRLRPPRRRQNKRLGLPPKPSKRPLPQPRPWRRLFLPEAGWW